MADGNHDSNDASGGPVSQALELVVGHFIDPSGPASTNDSIRVSLTSAQQLYFYSSDAWEMFVRECAAVLKDRYRQVKPLGGANDEGVDVAGFKTDLGFEGAWDCWQGKHYANALVPSDAYPEILKVLRHVTAGNYVLPDAYYFAAPRGCGRTLSRLLSKPTELKSSFLTKLVPGNALTAGLTDDEVHAVRAAAESTDFSIFKSVEAHELLELHASSPYHQARFAGPLPDRPPSDAPPDEVCPAESRYIDQLVRVYQEYYPGDQLTLATLGSHEQAGPHFYRQRLAFYSAESLRRFARDSVPPGTYEGLQDDIHDGVVEIAESDHETGLDRLRSVVTASAQVDLSGHPLISVSKVRDRHGICHQLSNDGRLSWLKESP
jgi:hypothetical protein